MKFSTSLLTLTSLLALTFACRAAEPGFAFSGQLLELDNSKSSIARLDGKTSYATKIYLRLYDDSEVEKTEKTQALWGRCIDVDVQDGNFACRVSDAAGTPIAGLPYERLEEAFQHLSGARLSVGVTPFDDNLYKEISPRQTLTAVPYAVCASDALGSVGDLAVPGSLSAAAVTAAEAVFNGTVTHAGTVYLNSQMTLPKLVLDDSRTLDISNLAAEQSASVTNATVTTLTADSAEVSVAAIGELVATNLSFSGNASVKAVTPPGGAGDLVVHNDVGTPSVSVTDIEVRNPLALFKWDATSTQLGYLEGGPDSSGYFSYSGSTGWWTSKDKNTFMNLSFKVGGSSAVTISVGGTEVGCLAVKGGTNQVWMSFQTFVKKGEEIRWTGMSDPSNGTLVVTRGFSY